MTRRSFLSTIIAGQLRPLQKSFLYIDDLAAEAVALVIVVDAWRLGPLEKGFPSKRYHAARVGGKNRELWRWFAK